MVDAQKLWTESDEQISRNWGKPILWAWHLFEITYLSRPLADSLYCSLGITLSCEKRRWKGSISTSGPELLGVLQNSKNTKTPLAEILEQIFSMKFASCREAKGSLCTKHLQKIWRDVFEKIGKTDFVGLTLCRYIVLVAPSGGPWVMFYRDHYEMRKAALERGRYLLPVQSYKRDPKIVKKH